MAYSLSPSPLPADGHNIHSASTAATVPPPLLESRAAPPPPLALSQLPARPVAEPFLSPALQRAISRTALLPGDPPPQAAGAAPLASPAAARCSAGASIEAQGSPIHPSRLCFDPTAGPHGAFFLEVEMPQIRRTFSAGGEVAAGQPPPLQQPPPPPPHPPVPPPPLHREDSATNGADSLGSAEGSDGEDRWRDDRPTQQLLPAEGTFAAAGLRAERLLLDVQPKQAAAASQAAAAVDRPARFEERAREGNGGPPTKTAQAAPPTRHAVVQAGVDGAHPASGSGAAWEEESSRAAAAELPRTNADPPLWVLETRLEEELSGRWGETGQRDAAPGRAGRAWEREREVVALREQRLQVAAARLQQRAPSARAGSDSHLAGANSGARGIGGDIRAAPTAGRDRDVGRQGAAAGGDSGRWWAAQERPSGRRRGSGSGADDFSSRRAGYGPELAHLVDVVEAIPLHPSASGSFADERRRGGGLSLGGRRRGREPAWG